MKTQKVLVLESPVKNPIYDGRAKQGDKTVAVFPAGAEVVVDSFEKEIGGVTITEHAVFVPSTGRNKWFYDKKVVDAILPKLSKEEVIPSLGTAIALMREDYYLTDADLPNLFRKLGVSPDRLLEAAKEVFDEGE